MKKVSLYFFIIYLFYSSLIGPSFLFTNKEVSAQSTNTNVINPSDEIEIAPVQTSNLKDYHLLAPLPGLETVDSSMDIKGYVNTILRIVIGIIGVLAVVMIIVGGVQYMSTDAIGKKEGGKETIQNAVWGVILALGSFLILNTINPQLTSLSFGVKQAAVVGEKISVAEDIIENGNAGKSTGNTTPWTGEINATRNVTTYDAFFKKYASKYGVECTILKSHAYVESNMDPKVTSSAGAVGLMQIMPKTVEGLKLGYTAQDMYDPEKAIDAGAFYISQLKIGACPKTAPSTCTPSNYDYVAAAYNGGSGNNGLSKDCPASQNKTKWQCEINRGGLQETYDYVGKIDKTRKKLSDYGWGC